METKGIIFILSGPSGGGKTFIAKKLLELFPEIKLSISHTTRSPRLGEEDGREYYFHSEEDFLELIENDQLLEYAEIYKNYYGTLKKPILDALNCGTDVLFNIDAQGAKSIASKINSRVVTIFLIPASIEALRKRLIERGDHPDEKTLTLRSSLALSDIRTAKDYEYIVTNDQLDVVLNEIKAIIIAERIRNNSQHKLKQFLDNEDRG